MVRGRGIGSPPLSKEILLHPHTQSCFTPPFSLWVLDGKVKVKRTRRSVVRIQTVKRNETMNQFRTRIKNIDLLFLRFT